MSIYDSTSCSSQIVNGGQRWYKEVMAKHSHGTGNPNAARKKTQIQNWLLQQGWKLTEASAPQVSWAIRAQSQGGPHVTIIQPLQIADQLQIHGGVSIEAPQQAIINAMDTAERHKFLWDLRFNLLAMAVDFDGVTEPLQQITMNATIFDDALRKDVFFQRVGVVVRAVVFVLWTVRKQCQEPPLEISSENN
jgi:hypothetical protein